MAIAGIAILQRLTVDFYNFQPMYVSIIWVADTVRVCEFHILCKGIPGMKKFENLCLSTCRYNWDPSVDSIGAKLLLACTKEMI